MSLQRLRRDANPGVGEGAGDFENFEPAPLASAKPVNCRSDGVQEFFKARDLDKQPGRYA